MCINRNSHGSSVSINLSILSIFKRRMSSDAQWHKRSSIWFYVPLQHRQVMNRSMNEKFMEDSNSLGGIKPIQPKRRNMRIVLGFAFVAVVLFLVGFLIGYFVMQPGNKPCRRETTAGDKSNDFEEFHELFKETISAEKLESVIRYDKLMWYYYASIEFEIKLNNIKGKPTKNLLLDLNQFVCNVVTNLYLHGGNTRQTNVCYTLK